MKPDGSEVLLEKTGDKGAELAEAVENLPDDSPRMLFFMMNFEYEKRKITKPVLINWMPNTAPIKLKFVYSSSKGSLLNTFTGIRF